ncbi:hypothetical protein SapgrDRAFT_1961 [Saprospira grandis DSM 2844]|uniref:Uncharacterized protein n=1 Tax=Saprospira grandis DSM 2844 TaxID=694433 RepID=J0P801_9BACT|nr:hypothetical protein SapgrDRAFT_1961 [Saprospira grandis DSM 2844]
MLFAICETAFVKQGKLFAICETAFVKQGEAIRNL